MMMGKVKQFQAPEQGTFPTRTFWGHYVKQGFGFYFCQCLVVDLFVVGLLFLKL
jgi:hypothetical protein